MQLEEITTSNNLKHLLSHSICKYDGQLAQWCLSGFQSSNFKLLNKDNFYFKVVFQSHKLLDEFCSFQLFNEGNHVLYTFLNLQHNSTSNSMQLSSMSYFLFHLSGHLLLFLFVFKDSHNYFRSTKLIEDNNLMQISTNTLIWSENMLQNVTFTCEKNWTLKFTGKDFCPPKFPR